MLGRNAQSTFPLQQAVSPRRFPPAELPGCRCAQPAQCVRTESPLRRASQRHSWEDDLCPQSCPATRHCPAGAVRTGPLLCDELCIFNTASHATHKCACLPGWRPAVPEQLWGGLHRWRRGQSGEWPGMLQGPAPARPYTDLAVPEQAPPEQRWGGLRRWRNGQWGWWPRINLSTCIL